VYFKERYDRLKLALILIVLVGVTAGIVRLDMRHYLTRLRAGEFRGIGSGGSTIPPAPPPPSTP
jgi:hypothetical protein